MAVPGILLQGGSMNLDLLSMSLLSICAFVVVVIIADTLGTSRRQRITIGAWLGLWFAGVCAVGASRLIAAGGLLATGGLGTLVILPIAILSLAVFLSRRRLERIRRVNMFPLISVQILRVLGVIFVLLFAAHRLPAPFAPTAGYGDILTAFLAIPLAWAVAKKKKWPRLGIWLWSALGMGDLITAIALGALSAPSPFQVFRNGPGSAIMPTLPWVLIPGFLVPCFFFLHMVVLVKMRNQESDSPHTPVQDQAIESSPTQQQTWSTVRSDAVGNVAD
jgi:hypothetical protein